jgi:hypothetical protein
MKKILLFMLFLTGALFAATLIKLDEDEDTITLDGVASTSDLATKLNTNHPVRLSVTSSIFRQTDTQLENLATPRLTRNMDFVAHKRRTFPASPTHIPLRIPTGMSLSVRIKYFIRTH